MEKKLANLTDEELNNAQLEIISEKDRRWREKETLRRKVVIKGYIASEISMPRLEKLSNSIDILSEDMIDYIYGLICDIKSLKEKE